jgi:hypothetical protein
LSSSYSSTDENDPSLTTLGEQVLSRLDLVVVLALPLALPHPSLVEDGDTEFGLGFLVGGVEDWGVMILVILVDGGGGRGLERVAARSNVGKIGANDDGEGASVGVASMFS